MTRRVDVERAARAFDELLAALGAPVETDPELRGTGARAAAAWADDLLAGYDADPAAILGESTASSADALVVLRDLPATTMCPHHLLPAVGVVHVAYLPAARVVGFGAVGELVDCYTRRFALQEDIACEIARALATHLGAHFAYVAVDLSPTCVTSRGARRHPARALTVAAAGPRASDRALCAEVASLLSRGASRAAAEPA